MLQWKKILIMEWNVDGSRRDNETLLNIAGHVSPIHVDRRFQFFFFFFDKEVDIRAINFKCSVKMIVNK